MALQRALPLGQHRRCASLLRRPPCLPLLAQDSSRSLPSPNKNRTCDSKTTSYSKVRRRSTANTSIHEVFERPRVNFTQCFLTSANIHMPKDPGCELENTIIWGILYVRIIRCPCTAAAIPFSLYFDAGPADFFCFKFA